MAWRCSRRQVLAASALAVATIGRDGRANERSPDAGALQPPTPLTGHRAAVWSVAFSGDGRRLISADQGGVVKFWDVTTGTCRGSIQAHACPIRAAALTPDGKVLASVGGVDAGQGEVKLWEVAETKAQTLLRKPRSLQGHTSTVLCLAIAPDGKTLATGGWDRTLRLWDIAAGKERYTLRAHRGLVHCVAFAPDGRLLASAGWDGVVRLWDAATGRERAAYQAHRDERIHGLAFSPDGRTLASASMDRAVKLYEVASGKERAGWQVRRGLVVCLAFAPDGRTLVGGNATGAMHVWDLPTGKRQDVHGRHDDEIRAIAFRADGRLLASAGFDATMLLWPENALFHRRPMPEVALSNKELEAAWTDLGGADAVRAGRAVWTMTGAAGTCVPFLKARLRPERVTLSRPVDQLIGDLDHRTFRVRELATAELARLGELAEPALRKALASRPPPETRRRVQRLLDPLESLASSGTQLRTLRAIEVLEHVATPHARKALETLAGGAPVRRVTVEAKAALGRLARR